MLNPTFCQLGTYNYIGTYYLLRRTHGHCHHQLLICLLLFCIWIRWRQWWRRHRFLYTLLKGPKKDVLKTEIICVSRRLKRWGHSCSGKWNLLLLLWCRLQWRLSISKHLGKGWSSLKKGKNGGDTDYDGAGIADGDDTYFPKAKTFPPRGRDGKERPPKQSSHRHHHDHLPKCCNERLHGRQRWRWEQQEPGRQRHHLVFSYYCSSITHPAARLPHSVVSGWSRHLSRRRKA